MQQVYASVNVRVGACELVHVSECICVSVCVQGHVHVRVSVFSF